MLSADLEVVAAIEAGSYSHPWKPEQFLQSLRAGHRCCVAARLGNASEVVGYAVTMAGFEECHLLNLTVHRDARRRGLARWMLDQVCATARADGQSAVWLEVRQGNAAAILLYEQAGFVTVGRRPGYYPALRGREDALLMTLTLPPALSDPPNEPPPDALDR